MRDEHTINYEKVVERMVEEAGAKNPRTMAKKIGAPPSYAYQMKERGVSKGFLEKYIDAFPEADLNYIFTGRRSQLPGNPEGAIQTLLSHITEDQSATSGLMQEYKEAIRFASGRLSRGDRNEEILQLLLRLLSIALEKRQ